MAEGRDPKPNELAVMARWEKAILAGRDAVSLVLARAALLNRVDVLRKDPKIGGYLPAIFSADDQTEMLKYIERWNKIEKLFFNGKEGILPVRVENGDITIYSWPGQKSEVLTGPVGLGWVVPMVVGAVILAGCVVATTALIAWFKNKETDLQARALEVARVMATAPGDVRQAYQELRASDGYRKDQGFLDSLLSKGSSMFGVVVALVAVALMIDVGKLFKGRAASREPVENPVGGRCAMIEENPLPGYVVPPSRGGRKGGVYWSHDPRKRKRQAAYIQDWIDRATTDAYIEYYRPGKRAPVRISQEVPF